MQLIPDLQDTGTLKSAGGPYASTCSPGVEYEDLIKGTVKEDSSIDMDEIDNMNGFGDANRTPILNYDALGLSADSNSLMTSSNFMIGGIKDNSHRSQQILSHTGSNNNNLSLILRLTNSHPRRSK